MRNPIDYARTRIAKVNYTCFLVILLLVFAALYFSDFFYRDLWANLLASLTIILAIDQIIKRGELQKSQRSIKHVRNRIGDTCTELIMRLRPPGNWRDTVDSKGEFYWPYLGRVLSSREFIEKFESILDRYHYLIEKDLLNDLFDIVFIMNHFSWSLISTKEEQFLDVRVLNAALNSADAMRKALDIIKRHDLLKYAGWSLDLPDGGLQAIRIGEKLDDETLGTLTNHYEHQCSEADQFLKAMTKSGRESKA